MYGPVLNRQVLFGREGAREQGRMDYNLYLASGEKSTQIAYVRTPAWLRAGTMFQLREQ